jgi:hypothetical protein
MSEQKQQALADITRAVMHLMDGWKLETAEMQALLCMPKEVRSRSFHKFRDGQMAFPDHPDVLRRAQYLLRISEALRTTFPRNPEMSGRWIRQGHRRFGKRTPLTIMLNGGESGLIAVLSELDCTFSWDLTGSTAMPNRG